MKCEGAVIRYDVYKLTAADRLKYGFAGLGLAALVSAAMYRSLPLFLITGLPAAVLFPCLMRKTLKQRRLERLSGQFREAIGILSGYLSAGCSVENAFGSSVSQLEKLFGAKADICMEFRRIHGLVKLNRPVDGLIRDFAERSGLPDIRNFAEVFGIAGRTGGNLREIIDRTASVIREKMAVAEEITNMTASRRFEQKVMNLIPFFIIFYLDLTSPGFLDMMYTTLTGRIVMTGCLLVIAASYLLSKRILDIRV